MLADRISFLTKKDGFAEGWYAEIPRELEHLGPFKTENEVVEALLDYYRASVFPLNPD
jgi:hypothetical protein